MRIGGYQNVSVPVLPRIHTIEGPTSGTENFRKSNIEVEWGRQDFPILILQETNDMDFKTLCEQEYRVACDHIVELQEILSALRGLRTSDAEVVTGNKGKITVLCCLFASLLLLDLLNANYSIPQEGFNPPISKANKGRLLGKVLSQIPSPGFSGWVLLYDPGTGNTFEPSRVHFQSLPVASAET
ncbi:hypothetical protein K493DRAFT_309038 [Basidiobolus meristosporus CBS 931.73]|uniref:Uncharacterized protein n=1 Tax=Basidiobolus meristosporus CBS 931.73 TaxID=1314790 RepID=A0A1Y1WSQ8_9FUNG|nr:hypothetical protein K493DRAFT_309038 [Basidiobolus meristosporus CBS 931.73]|eukprot:ORX76338.1 hypothetical protein K493DRAFT_309038 [Basidiobolus meristosporus CBS 931.73]